MLPLLAGFHTYCRPFVSSVVVPFTQPPFILFSPNYGTFTEVNSMIMATILLHGLQALFRFDQFPTGVFSVSVSHLGSHVTFDCCNSFASSSLSVSQPFLAFRDAFEECRSHSLECYCLGVSDTFSWLYWGYGSFRARVRYPTCCIVLRHIQWTYYWWC